MPVTSFAEPDPANRTGGDKRTPNAWFALNEDRPLFIFAGLWTPWHGKRMAREEPADHEVYGFLTTEPNSVVEPVHKKAMPVILTSDDEMTAWLTEPWEEAKKLQRPPARRQAYDRGCAGVARIIPPSEKATMADLSSLNYHPTTRRLRE
ncbi:SOS response-associated peptidase family protein [Filomicrobium sp.]|uniref:SOS response-associated peptidase family protein n=1 Tax=Filomicrobium sp. TaxID=2024831 RepID=UPI00258A9DFA|nr:SOS response-associated peptidase family protein [Filomicrobium sp.]MCV0371693.1 SOS response-associated peptidase family protein [Filomicrobium sp.]